MARRLPAQLRGGSSLVLLAALASPAAGQISDVAWDPVEVIDDLASEVSTGSGISVAFAAGRWHVVYVRAGDVYYATHENTGWQTPEPVTTDIASSRAPHMAALAGSLHVVWEDDRLLHPEVWTRVRDSQGWSAEQCLTCDLRPSRDPVIASDGTRLFVAWEEESLGVRQVRGRMFDGSWGGVEIVSMSPSDAYEPSVSGVPNFTQFAFAWVDDRDADPEIYERRLYTHSHAWQAEERATNLPGPSRHPSIHLENCCGDVIFPVSRVAFEQDVEGVTEVFVTRLFADPVAISAVDLTPSVSPSIDGFAFEIRKAFGGSSPKNYVTWTDENSPPFFRHPIVLLGDGEETLTETGISRSAVGAIEGDPDAELMAIWIEGTGTERLVSRRGRTPGVTAVDGDPRGPSMLAVTPNPCRATAEFRLRLPADTEFRLQVQDIAGRLVRDFGPARAIGGQWTAARWDTRGASGERVRPGIYFATLTGGATRIVRSFVVLR